MSITDNSRGANEQFQHEVAADLAVIFLILQSSILDGVREQPHAVKLLTAYKAWLLATVNAWPVDREGCDPERIRMLMSARTEGLLREVELAALSQSQQPRARPN